MDRKNNDSFSLALVTGASGGIGLALCHLLAKRGINLIVTGRNAELLHGLGQELKKYAHVMVVTADLAQINGRNTIIEAIKQYKPDLVVNNAGFGYYGETLNQTTHEQVEMINVNVLALLELTLESARVMIASTKPGVIVNVSSAADRLIFPYLSVYSASKAFVSHFSQSIDYEMASKGIRVLTACPGVVNTGFRKRASSGNASTKENESMSASYAAEQIWLQIEKRQRIHVFDFKTRLGLYIAAILPQRWVAWILARSVKKMANSLKQ